MLSNPSILDVFALISFVLGLVGQVSLFAFPRDRRVLERVLAVVFTVMVGGGVGLAWRAEQLRDADRDMTATQVAGLREALAANPGLRFEVLWGKGDREAQVVARKIAQAVKDGTGSPPVLDHEIVTPLRGVVLGVRDRSVGAGLAVDPIGRALMAARIATISDAVPDLPADTMRIVIGRKP
jgi:hypothetical protein